MAEGTERKKVKPNIEDVFKSAHKPSPEYIPHFELLPVADLQVDYDYQHQPYAKAIDDLNRQFQVRHCGPILVNEREDTTRWILDGQTRHAVHKLRQFRWIVAEMLYGLTQAEEAAVYLLKCINTKRMPVDFFLAEYVARVPLAVLIHDVLAKREIEIESYATAQRSRTANPRPVVNCVTYLKRMIRREPTEEGTGKPTGEVLGMTLDLIHDTWEYSGNSLTANFLDTLHKILVGHGDEIDRKAFIDKLGRHRPEELREQALLRRLGTTPQQTISSALQHVMIDLYNSGRPQHRRITLGSPNRS
jgi:hypothetical protein